MALSNPDRLVQVKHLSTFLEGLRNLFLTSTTADTRYANIGGSLENNFLANKLTANTLQVHSGVEDYNNDINIVVGEMETTHLPAICFIDSGGNLMKLPLDGSSFATVLDLEDKCNVVNLEYSNKRFAVDPQVSVFYKIIDSGGSSLTVTWIEGYAGTIVYYNAVSGAPSIYPNTFSSGTGFYMITASSNAPVIVNPGETRPQKIDSVEFICAPSPHSLYYCTSNNYLYRYNTSTLLMSTITPHALDEGGSTDPTDDNYEIAQDSDIAEIFDLITD